MVELSGKSLERASWVGSATESDSVGGMEGNGLGRVREPSGLGTILRNSYGSMEVVVGGFEGESAIVFLMI